MLWKPLGLFVSITSIDVPFCDLTQVTPFTRLKSKKVSKKSDKWYLSPFFRFSKLIFKSPIMSIFLYVLAILYNDLFNSIKNAALFLLYGGLWANVKHHFLFHMVISSHIVSIFLISYSKILVAISPSFTYTIFPPLFLLRFFLKAGYW